MSARKLNLFSAIDFLVRVEKGPDKGKAYRIRPPKITIGRDPSSQIVLTDAKASRQQCVIKFTDNIICEDLSSRKTTLVNGKPCRNHILRPGDLISFGETELKFLAQTKPEAKPQLPGQKTISNNQVSKNDDAKKKRMLFFGVIASLVVGLLILQEDPVAEERNKLITQEEVNKQIEESKERTTLIRESREEKQKLTEKKYLYNVERHFISGFRDFQNAQYSRAIDSFGTTIATDKSHDRARQYAKTAEKKKNDLIDTIMRDGTKYREKMMYNRCAAAFEKAIILIDNINSKKYELAKTQLEECRILKAGGY